MTTTPDTFPALAARLDLLEALQAEVVILMEYAYSKGQKDENDRLFGLMTWESPRPGQEGQRG